MYINMSNMLHDTFFFYIEMQRLFAFRISISFEMSGFLMGTGGFPL